MRVSPPQRTGSTSGWRQAAVAFRLHGPQASCQVRTYLDASRRAGGCARATYSTAEPCSSGLRQPHAPCFGRQQGLRPFVTGHNRVGFNKATASQCTAAVCTNGTYPWRASTTPASLSLTSACAATRQRCHAPPTGSAARAAAYPASLGSVCSCRSEPAASASHRPMQAIGGTSHDRLTTPRRRTPRRTHPCGYVHQYGDVLPHLCNL